MSEYLTKDYVYINSFQRTTGTRRRKKEVQQLAPQLFPRQSIINMDVVSVSRQVEETHLKNQVKFFFLKKKRKNNE